MNRSTTLPTILSAALCAASAATQNAAGLLYTPLVYEISNQCAATPALNGVRTSSLEYVEPRRAPNPNAPPYPYNAKAYMPTQGYNVVAGDADCDGRVVEPAMFGSIDAVMHPRRRVGGDRISLDKSRVFFSTRSRFTDLASTTAQPGDIVRLLPQVGTHGRVQHFLHEADIRAAFNMSSTALVDVDAVAIAPSQAGRLGVDIYLSFESRTEIDIAPFGPMTIEDGAIVCIPATAVGFWNGAADGAALVSPGTVAAGSGLLIATETDVDGWVAMSGISNNLGDPLRQVGDLDGLTLDPAGGFHQTNWAPTPIPNLLLSGENLTGAGIVSTFGGGSIAELNSVGMGNAAPAITTGEQVGLVTPIVRSLDGLALTAPNTTHFSLDTPTERILAPGPLTIELGGGSFGGAVLLFDLGAVGPCAFDPGSLLVPPNTDFRVLYPTVALDTVMIGADGCGVHSLPLPPIVVGLLSGLALEFQAFQSATPQGFAMTNPGRVEFF